MNFFNFTNLKGLKSFRAYLPKLLTALLTALKSDSYGRVRESSNLD